MVNMFNRKELLITYSSEEQARVRNILADNGIDYYTKTMNRMSPSPFAAGMRARTGSFGIDHKAVYEYRIFVKKEDFERACYLIRN